MKYNVVNKFDNYSVSHASRRRKGLKMYIDNTNNGQKNPFSTPASGFATPTPGFQKPFTPVNPQPVQEPVSVNPAPMIDPPDGFIEGWDDFEFDESSQKVHIKVFGIGGGGNNAVNRMFLNGEKSADMVVVNTDIPVLRSSPVRHKIAIGRLTTRGHGAGANPEAGRKAAEESIELIKNRLQNVDMLYITAGMGGGTGTGASPVIAKAAKELGILTVAVVTKPFEFEGGARMAAAEDGINKLRQNVDAVIVVPNERLLTISNKPLEIKEAFRAADEILIKGVQSICRLINDESYINLDFADVTTILRNSGDAHIGIGIASGENKAMLAAEQAINSPLLETSIKEADGMIISIIANENIVLNEVTEATQMIKNEASPNARIIWGLKFDPEIGDGIEITVIATRSGGMRELYPEAPAEATDMNMAPQQTSAYQQPPVQPQYNAAPSYSQAPQQRPVQQPAAAQQIPQQQEPVQVKPQDQTPPQRPASFYTDLDFKFLQNVAMRKDHNLGNDDKK